jgi:hypothetical protein
MLGPEDIKHLLFCCARAIQVCRELSMLSMVEQAMKIDRPGSVVLEHILCSPNSNVPSLEKVKLHELLAVGGWYIWWQRREIVKGEHVSPPPPKSSAFVINDLAANFGAVKHIGIVLRDDKGQAIAGKACLLNNMMCVATAEAMSLLRGQEFFEHIGCSLAYIESDFLELIQACNGDTEVLSSYTVVLADCFQIVSRMDLVIFQHCFRDANTVAHNLAKHAYETKVNLFWDDNPRGFIADVIRDVTLLEVVTII